MLGQALLLMLTDKSLLDVPSMAINLNNMSGSSDFQLLVIVACDLLTHSSYMKCNWLSRRRLIKKAM